MSDTPKVLVVVNDGVASCVSEGAVLVAIFDWDDYKYDPQATGRVSAKFAELARLAQVPCEGDVDD